MNYINLLKEAIETKRSLGEMKDVLKEKISTNDNIVCYFMFRNAIYNKDKDIFYKNGFRYDITIIPALLIGEEYNKTYGHYHPSNYGEVYEVLEGNAIFLLQNEEEKKAIAVYAEKGDVVLIPKGYGHITINPNKNNTLIMCNIVSDKFISIYTSYKEKQGGAFYFTTKGWIKNTHYNDNFELIEITNKDINLFLPLNNIYEEFLKDKDKFKIIE